MTTSTHTYTAVLVGSPDLPLSVKGGSITDDDSAIPKVTATLEIAMPAAATLVALDPRTAKRVRVTCGATFTNGTAAQTRVYNLGLRDREVDHKGGVIRLSLASDEALADDFAPLVDDLAPFDYQSSLRSLVNYALGKAITGATLEATPSGDASAQTYADATNLAPDPSFESGSAAANTIAAGGCTVDYNDTSWFAVGTKSINLYSPTTSGSYIDMGGGPGAMRWGLQAGREYVVAVTGRVKAAVGGTADTLARRAVLYYRTATSGYLTVASPAIPTTVGTATRVSLRFKLPEDTVEAWVRLMLGHSDNLSQVQWDALRVSEYTGDPTDTDFFAGSSTGTAGYAYGWSGPVNASTSRRQALISRPVDALRWPSGKSAMDFLRPLVQVAGFRLVNDEARKWTLRPIGYTVAGALNIRTGINLIDGRDAIRRDSGLWYDAQATVYTWTDPATGKRMTATDAYATTTPYQRLNRVEVDAAYPGPGRSQYSVQRAASRGREISLTAVSDWTAAAEQQVSAYLDNTPIQTGQSSRVQWDLDTDEMTVTTRSTDTPASAWDLIPAGQTWASQPVGGTWTGEVI